MKVIITYHYYKTVDYDNSVVLWIDNQTPKSREGLIHLAEKTRHEVWMGKIILKKVCVTQIKDEKFQRELEDSQVNILIDYFKVKLDDQSIEILDLRGQNETKI